MPTGNLPKEGADLFEKVYNDELNGKCKGNKECAAKRAWGAVKNAGWHKVGDKWVKDSIAWFSMTITKAVYDKASGEMRWSSVASDTDEDSYGESMTIELFNDFINRAEENAPPPPNFCSEGWCGGMPYMSVSHYPDMQGYGIAGDTRALYVDGNRLKANGVFRDTSIGRACFKAVCANLYDKEKADQPKVRISIGFLDWAHRHGDSVFTRNSLTDVCKLCAEGVGNKKYARGQLIHLALTRVPVNQRTDIKPESEVEKAMASTRKDDAASIVGDELAEELDERDKQMVGKSEALVEKAEEEEPVYETVEVIWTPEEDGEADVEEAANADVDAAQKARSRKYGIAILSVGQKTKPKQWESLSDSEFCDPVNYRYPIPDKAHAANAAARFAQEGSSYKGKEKIGACIKRKEAAKGVKAAKEEKKSDTEVDKQMDGSPAIAYAPLGGATTWEEIDELEKAQDQQQAMYDAWYKTSVLLQNITTCGTCEDKKKLMQKAVAGLQKRLEVKAMVALAQLSESGVFIGKSQAESHPLDTVLETLKVEFDKLDKSEDTPEEKLSALQESFNAIGETLKSLILKPANTEETAENADPLYDAVEKFSAAIQAVIQPLAEQVSLLNAQLSAKAGGQIVSSATPPRRNLQTPAVIKAAQPVKGTSKLHDLVRRSVGFED